MSGVSVHARTAWMVAAGALFAVAACVVPFVVSAYHTFQLTLVMVYAIALLGLNIATGYSGQISLGHGAFFAFGGYTAAILIDRFAVAYWAAIAPATLLSLVFGLAVARPLTRLGGHYLALATFALALATPQILKSAPLQRWTGGVQGIALTKPDPPPGLPLDPDQWLYFLVLAIAIGAFLGARNLLRNRIGRAFGAVRDDPIAAGSLGIDLTHYRTLAFGLSGMLTGMAGALGAITVQFVAPESFSFFLSITLLVGVVVGGLASLPGAVFGAFFIHFVPVFADETSKAATGAIYGGVLIAVIYLLPGGVSGMLKKGTVRRGGGWRWRPAHTAHRDSETRP